MREYLYKQALHPTPSDESLPSCWCVPDRSEDVRSRQHVRDLIDDPGHVACTIGTYLFAIVKSCSSATWFHDHVRLCWSRYGNDTSDGDLSWRHRAGPDLG